MGWITWTGSFTLGADAWAWTWGALAGALASGALAWAFAGALAAGALAECSGDCLLWCPAGLCFSSLCFW